MADITFDCPHCKKPIQCDDQWGGHEIQCPMCQGALVVPQTAGGTAHQNPLVPKPPAGGASRLSFQQNAQQPAVANRSIPIRNLVGPAPKKKSPVATIVKWALVLIAVAAGVYFGWPLVGKWQDRANAKRREAEKNSDGGEIGHIARLNQVLDATDPSHPRLDKLDKNSGSATGPRQRESGVATPIPVSADGAPPAAPGAAAGQPQASRLVYTLDVAQAQIPEGPVSGTVSGNEFVPDLTRVEAVGPAQVLRLTQGAPTAPDREILVYLHLRPGDKLSDHTWTIAEDQKGADVPQLIKRWTPKPGLPTQAKVFSSGYAMKLELGQLVNGALPGKIFVALPDTEQSVAGGTFTASTSLPDVIAFTAPPQGVMPPPAAVAPPPTPGAPPPPAGSRYGRKR